MEPLVSVIVCVYNEDPVNLRETSARLDSTLVGAGLPYELVFVNDGSGAETTAALRELASRQPQTRLIELSRNFGQQAAITAGLDHAKGAAVVNIDSDLQDPPELIPLMVDRWREGYEVVYAQRSSRRDGYFKRTSAHFFYRLLGSVSSVQIPRDTGDFRLMDRKVVDALRSMPERTRFLRGLVPWLGFRQIGIEIDRGARDAGQSAYTLKKLFALAMDGLVSFSAAPLYSVVTVGAAMIAIGVLALCVWLSIHWGRETHLGAELIVCVALMIGGIEVLSVGLVGVYVSKILDEVRRRPIYVVSSIVGSRTGDAQPLPIDSSHRQGRDLALVGRSASPPDIGAVPGPSA